jgi:hypothetical protein
MDKRISPPDLDKIDYLLTFAICILSLILFSDPICDLKIPIAILSIPILLIYIFRKNKKLVK